MLVSVPAAHFFPRVLREENGLPACLHLTRVLVSATTVRLSRVIIQPYPGLGSYSFAGVGPHPCPLTHFVSMKLPSTGPNLQIIDHLVFRTCYLVRRQVEHPSSCTANNSRVVAHFQIELTMLTGVKQALIYRIHN